MAREPEGIYSTNLAIESFFSDAPWPAEEDIGGWFFRGHDANDHYQEFVLKKPVFELSDAHLVEGWIDWTRFPIPKGNVLL